MALQGPSNLKSNGVYLGVFKRHCTGHDGQTASRAPSRPKVPLPNRRPGHLKNHWAEDSLRGWATLPAPQAARPLQSCHTQTQKHTEVTPSPKMGQRLKRSLSLHRKGWVTHCPGAAILWVKYWRHPPPQNNGRRLLWPVTTGHNLFPSAQRPSEMEWEAHVSSKHSTPFPPHSLRALSLQGCLGHVRNTNDTWSCYIPALPTAWRK